MMSTPPRSYQLACFSLIFLIWVGISPAVLSSGLMARVANLRTAIAPHGEVTLVPGPDTPASELVGGLVHMISGQCGSTC
jgi:hypothetical protein